MTSSTVWWLFSKRTIQLLTSIVCFMNVRTLWEIIREVYHKNARSLVRFAITPFIHQRSEPFLCDKKCGFPATQNLKKKEFYVHYVVTTFKGSELGLEEGEWNRKHKVPPSYARLCSLQDRNVVQLRPSWFDSNLWMRFEVKDNFRVKKSVMSENWSLCHTLALSAYPTLERPISNHVRVAL